MASSPEIAKALLNHVSDGDVMGSLLNRVNLSKYDQRRLPACPPDGPARSLSKSSVAMAGVIAASTNSPKLLDKLARDSRVSVRRLVAENASLGEDTARYLWDWAVRKGERGMISSLGAVLPTSFLMEQHTHLGAIRSLHGFPYNHLATQAVVEDNAKLMDDLVNTQVPNLRATHVYLAQAVYREHGVEGLDALISLARSAEIKLKLLRAVSAHTKKLRADLVRLVLAVWAQVGDAKASDGRDILATPSSISEEAASLLLLSDKPSLIRVVAGCPGTPAKFHNAVIAAGDRYALSTLVATRHHELTSKQLERALAGLKPNAISSWNAKAILERPKLRLSSEAVIKLLRAGEGRLFMSWITGEFVQKPRPGEITAVISNPDGAIQSQRHMNGWSGAAQAAYALNRNWHKVLEHSWANEAIESLGAEVFQAVVDDTALNQAIADRFVDAFGSNGSAWAAAVEFMPTWTGTTNTLIETVCLTMGILPPSMREPTVSEEEITGIAPADSPIERVCDQQLSLLELVA